MTVTMIKGNIFATRAQTIVNTINCVGVMGAGIALEFRLRQPEMFEKYATLCEEKKIRPGILWLYRAENQWILNFPTKDHWKHPSKPKYLELGLQKFAATYRTKGITSIAFPLLGADKGGLAKEVSLQIMRQYLDPLPDISVEIYEYSREAHDDLYQQVEKAVLSQDLGELSRSTGINKATLQKIIDAMHSGTVFQISQLGQLPGVGPTTVQKLFQIGLTTTAQGSLFPG